jgi:hypothetical protein
MKTSLIQILVFLCLFISTKQTYAQYTGGQADGHANLRLSNVACSVTSLNPYIGGEASGHVNLRLSNVVCAVTSLNPYIGGEADGHANLRLSNVTCAVTNLNPYIGGQADGHANLRLANLVCAVININPFNGGLADGHANLRLANLVCAVINVNPFNGGQADGHTLDSTIICPGIPLPIELLSFEGECKSGTMNLKWTTTSETDNDYFTIERSLDGFHFEAISKVKGAGNSNKPIHYSFRTFFGTSYYRLKQTNFDGSSKYSKFIYVDCQNSKSINVYPNPGSTELILEKTDDNELVNFEIINVLGIVVYKGSLIKKMTVQTTDFALGVYLIKLENGKTYKWIKAE